MADPTDIGEKLFSSAQTIIRKGREVAGRESRVLRLQTQISRLRADRQRLYFQMGEKVLGLFERDLVKNQDLKMMCQQIKGLEADIEMRRAEIDQLRRPETRSEGGVDEEPARNHVLRTEPDEDEIIRE